MSLLRDPKLIKIIAESLNIEQISDEACRMILSDLEQKLRLIINDATKYMKHFNREKIRIEDVNFALKDNNFFENFFGFEINENYEYSRVGDIWVLQNSEVDIKQQISKEIQKLKKFSKPKLSYKWLSIGGVVPKIKENSYILTNKKENEEIEINQNNEISNLNIADKNIEKISKEIRIIQTPNMLLSQEMEQFLNLLVSVLKGEELLIDEELLKGKYQESMSFKKMLSNIKSSSALNNLLPFVLNFILTDYNKSLYNGYEKKILHVKILLYLINNENIAHEFHLHIFIKILLHFLTSNAISVNWTNNFYGFKEITAKTLISLINLYENKYTQLKFQICEILLSIFNENLFNYQTNYGILYFFLNMDSVIIYELLLPLLIKLFESEQFSKDLSPDFHLDAEFNEIINNDDDDNNVHKLMKPKIKLLEKEENAKFSEVYKVYLLIMKCCCKLIAYFPYFQKSSDKEYSNLYYYFNDLMGEALTPYSLKILIKKRDLSSKLADYYKSQQESNSNSFTMFNPVEMFL